MYNVFFVQPCSFSIWMHYNNSLDVFDCCMKCVWTRIQMRLNEKPNTFKWEVKHVRMRSQTHSNKKPNSFEWKAKRLRIRNKTRLLSFWNEFERDLMAFIKHLKCFWRRSWTCFSLSIWNTFELDPRLNCFVCTSLCIIVHVHVLHIHIHCISIMWMSSIYHKMENGAGRSVRSMLFVAVCTVYYTCIGHNISRLVAWMCRVA